MLIYRPSYRGDAMLAIGDGGGRSRFERGYSYRLIGLRLSVVLVADDLWADDAAFAEVILIYCFLLAGRF